MNSSKDQITVTKVDKRVMFWFYELGTDSAKNLHDTNSILENESKNPPEAQLFMDEEHGKLVVRRVFKDRDLVMYNTFRPTFVNSILPFESDWEWSKEIMSSQVTRIINHEGLDVTLLELTKIQTLDTDAKLSLFGLVLTLLDKIPGIKELMFAVVDGAIKKDCQAANKD